MKITNYKKNLEDLLPIKFEVSKTNWIPIQKRLFELGYSWSSIKKLLPTKKYLYLSTKDKYITYSNDYDYFYKEDGYKILQESDVLKLLEI